jgi:hypothetical protein
VWSRCGLRERVSFVRAQHAVGGAAGTDHGHYRRSFRPAWGLKESDSLGPVFNS